MVNQWQIPLRMEDHNVMEEGSGEVYQEADVAEVLAASWRDKRQELNKLQKARQFGRAKDLKWSI